MCSIVMDAQLPMDADTLFHDIRFRSIGPAGMSGRVTTIDVDLKNPDIIYIGSASGGIWRSNDGGIDWNPIFDKEDVQSIGAVKIDPTNSDIIYAGTGEGNPRNSHTSGKGIYKSIDGGKTWKCMGLEETKLIHRIIVNPQNPNIVYAGTLGSAWGPNSERGLYKSNNGGVSWEKILYVNDSTGIADLVIDPSNPNKLIAATWQFMRKPWTFNSGGPGSGLHVTWDGGDTWKKIESKNGLPKGELGRIGLAISHNKPNIVYALIEAKKNGLYKSVDGGENWRLVSSKNIGNRPFYYADIYVDPQNENRLFNLWSYMSISEDGGKTFRTVLDYGKGVHPDHHAFWIHPDDPSYMLDGNDGGLTISRDGGVNWRHVTNLPLGQFYHVSIDEQIPFNIYGGMQDNGSWYGPSQVFKSGGIRNSDWREMYFGDGFDVMPVGEKGDFMYAMSQGGNVSLIEKQTGASEYVRPIHPEGVQLRFNWNAAIAADPFNEDGVYFGSQFVHYSSDRGKSWTIISPDLTTNDSTKQKQAKSGGLTIDATQAENYTTVLCIAPHPTSQDVIYAGTDDGRFHRTKDGGNSWTELTDRLPKFPKGAWISQIRHSVLNANQVFVVANDYRRNNWDPYLWMSIDGGDSWSRIVDEDDVAGHCHSIIQDTEQENLLFLGTEQGLYYSIDGGDQWMKWTHGFPSVPVRDLQISAKESALVVGTFGRSFYVLDDLNPFRALAENTLGDNMKLIAGPTAYQSRFKAADGIRFTADAEFEGENRSYGQYYYFYMPTETEGDETDAQEEEVEEIEESESDSTEVEKPTKRPKKITIVIKNAAQDTIYERKMSYKTGLNHYRWRLREQGPRGPSREKRKEEDLPMRWSVTPGEYLIVASLGDFKDSVEVEVKADPRGIDDDRNHEVERQYHDKVDQMYDLAGKATDQLHDMKSDLDLSKKLIVMLPDSVKKEWNSKIKDLHKTIDSLYVEMLGKEDQKGIDGVTLTLSDHIRRTFSYMTGAGKGSTQNLDNHLNHVIPMVNDWIKGVERYKTENYQPFQSELKELQVSHFKELDQLQVMEK